MKGRVSVIFSKKKGLVGFLKRRGFGRISLVTWVLTTLGAWRLTPVRISKSNVSSIFYLRTKGCYYCFAYRAASKNQLNLIGTELHTDSFVNTHALGTSRLIQPNQLNHLIPSWTSGVLFLTMFQTGKFRYQLIASQSTSSYKLCAFARSKTNKHLTGRR
jgi:hypothetical protein